MLDVDLFAPSDVARAVTAFHRDGFAAIAGGLSPEQLETARQGAGRVIALQTGQIKLEEANRGFARYSFGSQLDQPEWAMLIDLPTTLAIIDAIWAGSGYSCMGAGGDYSLPGATIQALHSDMGDFFQDPLAQVTFRDVPAPFIVINFLMVDFTEANGAIRFIPGTQRSHHPIPSLEAEPRWMQTSTLCAPAGTAVIRDVRCWHGGTANTSNEIRPMTSVGYYAPWFRGHVDCNMPREVFDSLSPRAQQLCRGLLPACPLP